MAIISNRVHLEYKDIASIQFEVTPNEIGKEIDFMGLLQGWRVLDVNVTIEEAFVNADNKISVGVEQGDCEMFIKSASLNAVGGIGFSNKQYTANSNTSVIATVTGTSSANGKAIVTVMYSKMPVRQEF
jgi:hypothetical protein